MVLPSSGVEIDPVFDPENIGASLDLIEAQIPVRAQWLQGSIVGDLQSKRRGRGIDIDGVRPYVPGDDPRYIDHKATARQPDFWPQIREHYADVTPSMWLISDMLQSRNSINPGYFSEQRLALSALMGMARIAQAGGIPTGVIVSNDSAMVEQPEPLYGRRHLYETAASMVANMDEIGPDHPKPAEDAPEQPRLNELLRYAASVCQEQIVVVVSDFRDSTDPSDGEDGWKRAMHELVRGGNDIVAIEVTNPWDFALPATVNRLKTAKGATWVTDKDRKKYAEDAAPRQAAIDTALKNAKAYHIKLSTAEPRWLRSFRQQLRG